jgi:hypothetical protein
VPGHVNDGKFGVHAALLLAHWSLRLVAATTVLADPTPRYAREGKNPDHRRVEVNRDSGH